MTEVGEKSQLSDDADDDIVVESKIGNELYLYDDDLYDAKKELFNRYGLDYDASCHISDREVVIKHFFKGIIFIYHSIKDKCPKMKKMMPNIYFDWLSIDNELVSISYYDYLDYIGELKRINPEHPYLLHSKENPEFEIDIIDENINQRQDALIERLFIYCQVICEHMGLESRQASFEHIDKTDKQLADILLEISNQLAQRYPINLENMEWENICEWKYVKQRERIFSLENAADGLDDEDICDNGAIRKKQRVT